MLAPDVTSLIILANRGFPEANSLLSTTQAGFRGQKDTIYQLQNIIMALEDAKLFGNNIYTLNVDLPLHSTPQIMTKCS